MTDTLTEAQGAYLKIAKMMGHISSDAISPGSSYRCVHRLVDRGLLEQRFVAGEGTQYFLTDAGREAIGR